MNKLSFTLLITGCFLLVLFLFARSIYFVFDQWPKLVKKSHKYFLSVFFLLMLFVAFKLLDRFYVLL